MLTAPGKADQAVVRTHNAALVLNHLRLHAPLSRADLAKRIGLNRSTVSSIVASLLDEGLVHETVYQSDKIGRPGLSLALNPRGGAAIGVEIAPESVYVLLTDFVVNVLWRRRLQIGPGETQETYIHCAEEMVRQALHHAQERRVRVRGIGLALPGLVDVEQGELKFAPSLRWHGVPFRARWVQRFGLPVYVENDANAAALGEFYFGAARAVPHFLYLGAGAGMSGGIVVDGRLFRGRGGFAGEIGHMTLDPDGALCSCGRQGCWETLVGPRAVVARYRQRLQAPDTPDRPSEAADYGFGGVVQAAEGGDLVALAVMQEVGRYLGVGIANLVNIFNPQLVVLGGLFSQAHETLLPAVKESLKQHCLFPMRTALSVVASQRGADDGVVGAAALALDDLLRAPV